MTRSAVFMLLSFGQMDLLAESYLKKNDLVFTFSWLLLLCSNRFMLLFYDILGNYILFLSISNASSQGYVQFLLGHAVRMFGNKPDLGPGSKC